MYGLRRHGIHQGRNRDQQHDGRRGAKPLLGIDALLVRFVAALAQLFLGLRETLASTERATDMPVRPEFGSAAPRCFKKETAGPGWAISEEIKLVLFVYPQTPRPRAPAAPRRALSNRRRQQTSAAR